MLARKCESHYFISNSFRWRLFLLYQTLKNNFITFSILIIFILFPLEGRFLNISFPVFFCLLASSSQSFFLYQPHNDWHIFRFSFTLYRMWITIWTRNVWWDSRNRQQLKKCKDLNNQEHLAVYWNNQLNVIKYLSDWLIDWLIVIHLIYVLCNWNWHIFGVSAGWRLITVTLIKV